MTGFLRNAEALGALEKAADSVEWGQSSYWRDGVKTFSVKADGTVVGASVLGMVSRKARAIHRAAHWVLQAPFRRMGRRFAGLGECLEIGMTIACRQNRAYTYDLLRHSLTLALVRHFLPDAGLKAEITTVIGDGYGMMASHLLLASGDCRVVVVNLTKPLLLDLVFIRQAVPGIGIALVRNVSEMTAALADRSVRCIAVQADNASALMAAPVGLALNLVSMQEMEPAVVAEYFRFLRGNQAARTAFYCCNRLWKRLTDGTETGLMEYPWSDKDQILLDETCGWSQWVYSAAPPFWHYRKGSRRTIWHRLAWLPKETQ